MLDKAVKIVNVKTAVGFDPSTLLPSRNVQVTYTVGAHGPFTLVTPESHFNEQYVETETGKMAATLRATGAIEP